MSKQSLTMGRAMRRTLMGEDYVEKMASTAVACRKRAGLRRQEKATRLRATFNRA